MQYILERVNRLVARHKTRDPSELAQRMGINVWWRDLGELKGFYLYERRSRYIVVNTALDEQTCRVVIAHELGHDNLHRELAREGLRENTLFLDNDKTELQANIFAAELLMCDREVADLIEEYEDIHALPSLLQLPLPLILIKITQMNKRGYHFPISEFRSNFL